jgi:hypothetical protein
VNNEADFRYEKFAAIALANWFIRQGYEARLSVPGPAEELESRTDLGGIIPPELSSRDLTDPRCRYDIYYDTPGRIDLVARNAQHIWLVEAKGLLKRGGAPGAVAQGIGQMVALMRPSLFNLRYGLLLPIEPKFRRAIGRIARDNPILSREDFCIYWVDRDGSIEIDRSFSAA